ncbi:PKD domain-containing protein [Rhodococcus qingshengii]|uniref:PKD domain-containing protein n=1 Tax=Rhodococcus qingshengii TaxID=334542 RepID=UPI001C8CC96C
MASVGVAPLSFEFDFENDGMVDAVNVDGSAGHVFERPRVYTVTLMVRDPRGRSSTTSMEVNVVADNENPQVPIDEVIVVLRSRVLGRFTRRITR